MGEMDTSEALLLAECQVCPECSVLVRREGGCTHIVCRCGQDFCFGCGAPMSEEGDECVCEQREDADMINDEDDMEGEGRPSLGFWQQVRKGLTFDAQPDALTASPRSGVLTEEQQGSEAPMTSNSSEVVEGINEEATMNVREVLLPTGKPPKLHRSQSLPAAASLEQHPKKC